MSCESEPEELPESKSGKTARETLWTIFYTLKGERMSLCNVWQRDFSFLSAVLKRGEAEENILRKFSGRQELKK